MTSTTAAEALASAAFGEEPGRWPLPAAVTPHELWLRAVAAGGQGRYGTALADLDTLHRTSPDGVQRSLAHSTRASFLRQLGGHARARGWDGRAWAGAVERSRQVADAALVETQRYGLIPLRWALCCLLADIGSSTLSPARVVAMREETADTVRCRGGVWTAR